MRLVAWCESFLESLSRLPTFVFQVRESTTRQQHVRSIFSLLFFFAFVGQAFGFVRRCPRNLISSKAVKCQVHNSTPDEMLNVRVMPIQRKDGVDEPPFFFPQTGRGAILGASSKRCSWRRTKRKNAQHRHKISNNNKWLSASWPCSCCS